MLRPLPPDAPPGCPCRDMEAVADARAGDPPARHPEHPGARPGVRGAAPARLAAAEAAGSRSGPVDGLRPDILEADCQECLGGCAAEHQRARTPAVNPLHPML